MFSDHVRRQQENIRGDSGLQFFSMYLWWYLIASVVEKNPREAKRFINYFIFSYEIYFEDPNVKPKEIVLLIQAFKERWKDFYGHMNTYEGLRSEIKTYNPMSAQERINHFAAREDVRPEYKDILKDLVKSGTIRFMGSS